MPEPEPGDETLHVAMLIGRDERDADALGAGAAGPADAMNVRLAVGGGIEVDHVGDPGHVETARGDIGRHERVDGSGLKAGEGLLALAL